MKDYLTIEQNRNKQHANLYARMLQVASLGPNIAVLVGHHIGFEFGGDIETENEIPSADTLIFDHDIMSRIFGSRSLAIMAELATIPAERRDARLQEFMNQTYGYTNPA